MALFHKIVREAQRKSVDPPLVERKITLGPERKITAAVDGECKVTRAEFDALLARVGALEEAGKAKAAAYMREYRKRQALESRVSMLEP